MSSSPDRDANSSVPAVETLDYARNVAPEGPPPPTASAEEKETYWFRHVYQGDVPQLTTRAVIMGGVLGMFMAISNLYTTLKLGWSFGVAITACVLSYVVWNALRGMTGNHLSQMSLLENNCMQSTASAAGMSTGSTVGTAFGALLLISGVHQPWYYVLPLVVLTAALGVFLAIPMKRQIINVEQLPFPSGIAAAETLRSLYGHGREAVRKAIALICGLCCGALVGFFRAPEGTLKALDKIYHYVHIKELVDFRGIFNPVGRTGHQFAGLGFEPGTLMIAAGAFVGLRVSLSMLAGSILLYYVVGPMVLHQDLAMAGAAGYLPSFTISAGGVINPVRWALWGGTAIMVLSSLTSVGLQWRTMARAFQIFTKGKPDAGHAETAAPGASSSDIRAQIDAVEVPFSWLIIGLVPIGLGLVAINYLAFDMNILLGIIAVAMSLVAALVCCRACGETDTTPIGAVGKLTQLLFAVLAKRNMTVNLMSASVAASAGGASADLLTGLKTGYLLGAHPRKQFWAQFLGIFFGAVAVVPAWYLMVPNKAVLESFNPPAANMWRAMAELLAQGLHTLPETARMAIIVGGLIGIALPLLSAFFPKAAPYMPSAMGLGLAWVVPFQNSLSFAIGAVLGWVWLKLHKQTADAYTYPIAAGLIAGESIVLALIAMAATAATLLGQR